MGLFLIKSIFLENIQILFYGINKGLSFFSEILLSDHKLG